VNFVLVEPVNSSEGSKTENTSGSGKTGAEGNNKEGPDSTE
jgi:hypothetical protein